MISNHLQDIDYLQKRLISLREDAEKWKERALNAEECLRPIQNPPLKGFTDFESKILHHLAKRGYLSFESMEACSGGGSSKGSFRTVISRCRSKLPDKISIITMRGEGWTVNSRDLLKAFIERARTKR